MKKILIDLTSLDDNFSGIEHYAFSLTKELIKNSNFSFELVFKNKISYFNSDEIKNVKVTILYGNRYNIMFRKLPKYINKCSPDYVIFLAFQPSPFWKPKKDIRVISTIHDLVAFDVPKTMTLKSRLYFRLAIKHSIKISYKINTISKFTETRLIDKFKIDEQRIIVSPCASSMPIIKKEFDFIKNKYNLPNEYVLALSTIEPRKNFDKLIEWMVKLWKTNIEFPDLVLVGRNGWKQEKILEKVPLDMKKKIHFTGFADEEDKYSLYIYSKTFVFPSIYEGFGMPILEASLANKMPVCSDIPTAREILGKDYLYLFDLNSFDSFKEKILENINCSKKETEKTINKINCFSWIISANNIIGCFK